MKKVINICDCTLRDGGYYTNWDFDEDTVKMYFNAMNDIPAITHIEIGYRSMPQNEYLGEYFYSPEHVLKMAKELCPNKEIAIMLNEKDTKIDDLDELLVPYREYIDLVRTAVAPINLDRARVLGKELKKRGFKVAFNLMYMSQWATDVDFIKKLNQLEGEVDYIYMVDSFGGVYPDDVKNALLTIKREVSIPIGFHGHNNMELGLANSLTAIESGCEIVDATITGMGRGAGNLKTELLLTSLNSKGLINIDFNKLNPIVAEFEKMQKQYQWGTSLPYMISGAYSLPQKDVMGWIAKRRFTTESIINALQNRKNQLNDNYEVPVFESVKDVKNVVIIGGGPNTQKHAHALKLYCKNNPETVLIHAGSRFVELFNELPNLQFYCLLGAEGYKLQKVLPKLNLHNVKCVLEPSPRKMGTILPDQIISRTFELRKISFVDNYPDSLLTIAFQLSLDLNAENVYLFGLDGYDMKTDEQMVEVSKENQALIDEFIDSGSRLISLTPSNYQGFKTISIYSKL
jgi:4-hydroxy 2-oxovalerate aldolase